MTHFVNTQLEYGRCYTGFQFERTTNAGKWTTGQIERSSYK